MPTTTRPEPVMRVRLIVTGDLERAALHTSLARLFPVDGAGQPVTFLRPLKVDCTTTRPLPAAAEGPIPAPISRLVAKLVGEMWNGSEPAVGTPELVMAVDDLELANLGQPKGVLTWLKRAIEAEVVRRYPTPRHAERLREGLRERCSFHFLVPMVEAYFFGETAALHRAGVAEEHPALLVHGDVETFESADPTYLAEVGPRNARMHDRGLAWYRHEQHPKHYLEHLVARSGGFYGEAEGQPALETLNWPQVPADLRATPFLRSLCEDLADALGVTSPLAPGRCHKLTWTERRKCRRPLVLRNL